jgi:hypothetical protein
MANPYQFSPAGQSLGLGGIAGLGTTLGDQVAGETDEERKKRMLELQHARLLGTSGSAGSAAGTALGLGGSLFGSMTSTGLLR